MMPISAAEQITPEWLTDRLTRRGILQRGAISQVRIVDHSSQRGTFANTAFLEVAYAVDAMGPVPARLFLKSSRPNLHPETLAAGEREVAFYEAMAGLSGALPIPRYYDGAYDAASGHSHLLIEDLSATHFQTVVPLPPSPRHCEQIVGSLAQIHAQWWNSPRIDRDLGHLCERYSASATRARLDATLPGFLDFLGDALLPAQRRVYERVLASPLLPRREERHRRLEAVTLTHGDAHAWSFMLPRDPESGRVMVIDWHLWEIGPPTDDLAYFMAVWWGPGRRAALERHLLKTYHRHLLDSGVEHYGWDACWRDYRESVALMTMIPIGQFRRRQNPATMWSFLENSTAAFEDLRCAEVL